MEKQKIILSILAAVSFLVWARSCNLASAKGKKSPMANKASATQPDFEKAPIRSAYQSWLRDPFTADKRLDAQENTLQLKGIIFDPADCYALINDQLVHIGDTVEGYKVVSITKDTVMVNDGNKNLELKLQE